MAHSDIEIPFRWVCPDCRALNNDTVNPDLGPYLNLTCSVCASVSEEQELDQLSAASWNIAMAAASALEKSDSL